MTFDAGDLVEFEREGGRTVTGRVYQVKGTAPHRVLTIYGPNAGEMYMIPERDVRPGRR